ncbi:CCAAT-box binding factor HAP3-like protein [Carex littledalei]|uniref:CCAAT-box binding factor HAP3-like protein n=1 Tax=Carex littledalei TaxID=544730 RepID=A0A833R6K8_9POAL|nr:CCAAT-box binding factor HAP3-like protein [Carex littledalei]
MWEWDKDHLLPLTHIINTMRRVLPADAGMPSDAAAIIQRATSDFILLVTSQARERYNRKSNKKIKGDDIIWALNKLGFTDYVRPLELYLCRYREHLKGTTQSGPSQLQLEQLSEASTSHGSQK